MGDREKSDTTMGHVNVYLGLVGELIRAGRRRGLPPNWVTLLTLYVGMGIDGIHLFTGPRGVDHSTPENCWTILVDQSKVHIIHAGDDCANVDCTIETVDDVVEEMIRGLAHSHAPDAELAYIYSKKIGSIEERACRTVYRKMDCAPFVFVLSSDDKVVRAVFRTPMHPT